MLCFSFCATALEQKREGRPPHSSLQKRGDGGADSRSILQDYFISWGVLSPSTCYKHRAVKNSKVRLKNDIIIFSFKGEKALCVLRNT